MFEALCEVELIPDWRHLLILYFNKLLAFFLFLSRHFPLAFIDAFHSLFIIPFDLFSPDFVLLIDILLNLLLLEAPNRLSYDIFLSSLQTSLNNFYLSFLWLSDTADSLVHIFILWIMFKSLGQVEVSLWIEDEGWWWSTEIWDLALAITQQEIWFFMVRITRAFLMLDSRKHCKRVGLSYEPAFLLFVH